MTDNNNLQLELKKLEKTVAKLNLSFKKHNSLFHNFSLGLVRGLGTAIGATVVFGLMVALVMQLIRSIDYVPLVNNIINSQAIEDLVSKFTQ